jgi:DNA-binding GntR family transcriptional regulator
MMRLVESRGDGEAKRSMTTGEGSLSAPVVPPIHTFEPVQPLSLADTVVVQLRQAIINRRLSAGDRLVETELADQFKVSRATIRQALLKLNFEGLVDIRPRRGVLVSRMSSREARDVCTVRGLLEGWSARAACAALTVDDFHIMRALARQMADCLVNGNVYRVVELDIEFHGIICRSDDNARLNEHWQKLNALHGALMSSRLAHYNYDPSTVLRLHEELCDVLQTRDPERAEQAVRLHYMGAVWEDDEDL